MSIELKPADRDTLVTLLGEQAAAYPGGTPQDFYRKLVADSALPSKFKARLAGVWAGDPFATAGRLVDWALARGINPADPRCTTVGSLLTPLLEDVGLDQARALGALIVAYRLYLDEGLLDDLKTRYQVPHPAAEGETPNQLGPSVRLAIDRVGPFRESQIGRHIVYGTVELEGGGTAYGEGLSLQLTLENLSDLDIVVPTLDVLIEDYDAYPVRMYDYPAFETSGTHLEMPRSTLSEPFELTEFDHPGSSVPVTKGRLFLRARGNVESHHTLDFALVARAPGVWSVRVQATFADTLRSSDLQVTQSNMLHIVKR